MADGTLIFDTKVDNKGLTDGLKGAERTGTSAGRKVGKAFAITGAAIAATGAAAVATGKKIWKMSNDVAAYGDVIDKQSQQVGLSYKAYQQWDYAMKIAGTSMQDCKMGLKTLTNTLDDARQGSETAVTKFERLGISIDSLNGKSREEVFATTIKQLQNVTDETERAALANDMFGKSGQNLLPLLNQTNAETEKILQQAEDYGLIMSDKAVKASAAFEDSLTKLQGTLTGVKNRMIGEFLPGITMIMDGLSDLAIGNDKGWDEIAKGFDSLWQAFENVAPKIMTALQKVGQAIVQKIPEFAPVIINGIIGLVSAVIGILPQMIPHIVDGIVQLVGVLVQSLPVLIPALMQGITQLCIALATNIPQYLPYFIQGAIAIIVGVAQALPAQWQAIASTLFSLITSLVNGIKTHVSDFIARGREFIEGLWNGFKSKVATVAAGIFAFAKSLPGKIKSGLGSLVAMAAAWIMGLKNSAVAKLQATASALMGKARAIKGKIKSALGSLVSIGRDFIQGFWNGIKGKFDSMVSNLLGKVSGLKGKIAGVLGIGSPSKVMAELGQWIPAGLAVGIEKNFGMVEDAMTKLGSIPAEMKFASPFTTFAGAGTTAGAGATGGQTVYQEVNFYQPINTPAQTARMLREEAMYGMARG